MSFQAKAQNGKIAEVLVELELLRRGWHVERLDGASKAVNGDLIAVKERLRVVVQVKGALSSKRPSFGHSTGFLTKGKPFFNGGNPTVVADFLVTVCGSAEKPMFHVFEITHAERIAQSRARSWFDTPTKGGRQRSPNFPLSLHLSDDVAVAAQNAWHLLETPYA